MNKSKHGSTYEQNLNLLAKHELKLDLNSNSNFNNTREHKNFTQSSSPCLHIPKFTPRKHGHFV